MKNIAIFFDGTGQTPENHTNISELYKAAGGKFSGINQKGVFAKFYKIDGMAFTTHVQISGANASEPQEQRLLYLTGIGIDKVTHKITGSSINHKLQQAYSFLIDNYVEGDKIQIFGFSRGAFSARSLVALIQHFGIISRHNQQKSPDKQKQFSKLSIGASFSEGGIEKISNLITRVFQLFEQIQEIHIQNEVLSFRTKYSYDDTPEISFLGLWDTVGSISDILHLSNNNKRTEQYLSETYLDSNIVKCARHALAIDEQRKPFRPTLWTAQNQMDAEQKWFVGAHADVGGGYNSDDEIHTDHYSRTLSESTLSWMADEIYRSNSLKLLDLQVLLPRGIKNFVLRKNRLTPEEREIIRQNNYNMDDHREMRKKIRTIAQREGRRHDVSFPSKTEIRRLLLEGKMLSAMENSLSANLATQPRVIGKMSANMHERHLDETIDKGAIERIGQEVDVEDRRETYKPRSLHDYLRWKQIISSRIPMSAVAVSSPLPTEAIETKADSDDEDTEDNSQQADDNAAECIGQKVAHVDSDDEDIANDSDLEKEKTFREKVIDVVNVYLEDNPHPLHLEGHQAIENLKKILMDNEYLDEKLIQALVIQSVANGPTRKKYFESILPKDSKEDAITQNEFSPDINDKITKRQKKIPYLRGLDLQEVSEDGHCFYYAIALYLQKDVKELRALVAQTLKENSEKYKPFIELPEGQEFEDYIEDRIQKILQDEWIDHLEMTVLMDALDQPILEVNPDGMIINIDVAKKYVGDPIFVHYNGTNHYDALVKTHFSLSGKEILSLYKVHTVADSYLATNSASFWHRKGCDAVQELKDRVQNYDSIDAPLLQELVEQTVKGGTTRSTAFYDILEELKPKPNHFF